MTLSGAPLAACADGRTVRDDRFVNRFQLIEAAIRSLGSGQQAALAVDLASLVQPFADISQEGQPKGGLPVVADVIRTASNGAEIERARHILWSIPELQDDEEPDGPAWFSLGATIAWIYAADSLTTAPSDGAVNAFKRAVDLLDAADETLTDTSLVDRFLDAVEVAIDTRPVALPPELRPSIRAAAARLAPAL